MIVHLECIDKGSRQLVIYKMMVDLSGTVLILLAIFERTFPIIIFTFHDSIGA